MELSLIVSIFHTWKNNGYKAYNKKPIKNKELICETYAKLQGKTKE